MDLVITIVTVVIVSVAPLPEPLAAAAATAPLTSTAALILAYNKSEKNIESLAFNVVKGVFSSLIFAVTLWYLLRFLKMEFYPALFLAYSSWTFSWLVFFRAA